jgi:inner membrane protein
MASFGHVAVGMLAGRLHGGGRNAGGGAGATVALNRRCSWATLVVFAVLAMLPDADLLMLALGLPDHGAVGHRGASHSLMVAVVAGLIAALVARRIGWPPLRTGIAATLAVASHGLLDTLGNGGRGIPLFWPLSNARFFAPWRLLPDAPRGLRLLSRHGLFEVALEFVVFFPATVFAVIPRLRARPQLVVIPGGSPASGEIAIEEPPPFDEREPPARSSA